RAGMERLKSKATKRVRMEPRILLTGGDRNVGRKLDNSPWAVYSSLMSIRALHYLAAAAALLGLAGVPATQGQTKKPAPPKSLRLYVLDCGRITGVSGTGFGFKEGQLATTEMITPCFLIVHPRGTMMWDVGEIEDSQVTGPNTKKGAFVVDRPLLPQLAA